MKTRPSAALAAALLGVTRAAWGGGFEIPDNGTEALGRGGAFTAKADDPTAIQYNIAGLAGQKGTSVLLDGHIMLSDYEFRRAGVYGDNPQNPVTPWGAQPYPLVKDTGGPFFAPFGAVTSDLGLERWTFALGAYGPSSVGNRTYPLGVNGVPSPDRYDVVQAAGLIIFPTAAAAYRLLPWLDLGAAIHVAYGHFNLTSTSYYDFGPPLCPNPEYQPCDTRTTLDVSAWSWTGSLGAKARPADWLELGLDFRGPVTLDATGNASAVAPRVAPIAITPAPAEFTTKLPWVVRAGARLVDRDHGFERGDVELDTTYEAWSSAQGDGPTVYIPQLGTASDIRTTIVHHYKDTISFRLGGAYNVAVSDGPDPTVLSLRAGAYYDQSATSSADTRMDFDTLDKYAATVGLGLRLHGLTLNVAYAELFEPGRTVTDGEIRPLNGTKNGSSLDASGNLLPVVNNGDYSAHTRIVSFGFVVGL